jgi:biotin synthase
MEKTVSQLLEQKDFTANDLVRLLDADENERKLIFEKASAVKNALVGNKVYFRGLIEYSNRCAKNCYYCGVRNGNPEFVRYQLEDDEVIEAARFAFENRFASIVIQAGERTNKTYVSKIEELLLRIKDLSGGKLGITLSLGEQTEDTYNRWFNAGAHRYLLRIETSNKELYYKIHPQNIRHSYEARLDALRSLKKIGYQVGTGVMIGLPFQTTRHLAEDLLFFKEFDIDMAGMGPYIEHENTPLYAYRDLLIPKKDRFYLSLKMVALLRILMGDINIAATTAMQTLDPQGREKAMKVGANVIMPNLTPLKYRENYLLYQDKPCIDEEADECQKCLEARIHIAGADIGWDEWGDSAHFAKRLEKTLKERGLSV